MVVGGHWIMICGHHHRCSVCRAKRRSHGRHCPKDVITITKTCRQIHLETSLVPLKTNVFGGHATDLYSMLKSYFWTQIELDAIETIWAIDGVYRNCCGFRRLRGFKEVIVSAGWTCWVSGAEHKNILITSMEEEIRTYGSNAKVRMLGSGEKWGYVFKQMETNNMHASTQAL